MYRKFSELSPSEQRNFNNLVEFMKDSWSEDIGNKLKIVQKFRLDPNDPVVFDFLTDVYVPLPSAPTKNDALPKTKLSQKSPDRLDSSISMMDLFCEQSISERTSLSSAVAPVQQIEKIKKREMTYANSEDLIIIQNRLLHAISHLTLNERRLILFLSPIVRKQIEKDKNNRVFYVYVQDFVNEYGIKSKKYYGELEKIADSIVEKAFFFWYKTENGKAKKGVSWVSECDYIENKGMIKVKLDDTVIEMLTVFDKATGNFWTQYQKEWIIHLGAYGIIMLEMILSSKENNGYYTVEHLREKFNCIDVYPRFSNFKLYVIDKSIKEIEKYTPIKISYDINKVGKSVKGLSFSYIDTSVKSIKNKKKNDDKSQENNPFVNFKMTPKQLAIFGSKIAKKIDKDIEIIIDEMSNIYLQGQYVEYLKLLDFVPSDWYSDDEIKEQQTAEEIAIEKQKIKQLEKTQEGLEQEQLKNDFEILLKNAKEFVLANKKRIGFGIERMYFEQEDYESIVRMWESYLLNKRDKKGFLMVEEILLRSS